MFSLTEILYVSGGTLLNGESRINFSGVSTDSRTTKQGDVFIAIKGDRFDGHNFLESAFRNGASGAIVSENPQPSTLNSQLIIKVPDTIKALGDIARFHRGRFDIPIVGITGSNGKTTTKDITAAILSCKYKALKNEGTFNNHIGVPQTILKLTDQEAAVLELGMNHFGEIAYLTSIVRPDVAVITNIGPAHLEFLGDLEGVFSAKTEILQYLDDDDAVILNGDDEYLKNIKYTRPRLITFGIKNKSCDFVATDIEYNDKLSFNLNGKTRLVVNLLGEHNIYNVLASCAVCSLFDIPPAQIQDALVNFKPPSMRAERIETINGIRIINDSYNSNPLSMTYALDILMRQATKGRKILIMGDMLELGKLSEQYHHNIGKKAAQLPLDLFITVGRMCRFTKEGAKEAGMPQDKLFWFDSAKDAAEFVRPIVKQGDCLLVKGSRKMMMERIVECFTTSTS